MEFINDKIIQLLVKDRSELCISAYMPTHRTWNETGQDLLRFKNLLKRIERELSVKEVPTANKERILSPLRSLQDDLEFWRYQQDGLGLFCTRNEYYYVKLPIEFEEEIFIGEQFHILPLIPAITETYDFYLLLLDQKEMKLYRSHHYSLQPVPVLDIPRDLEEAVAIDNPGRNLQFRQGVYAGGAGGGASFHGQGVDTDAAKQKELVLEYFRKANDAIKNVIGSDRIPMLLAGVDYLHSIYREANTYPGLYEKGLTKKISMMSEGEIFEEAHDMLKPHFIKVQQDALDLYGNLVSTKKTSDNIKEILQAAFSARISHLFVNHREKQWGRFDFRNLDVVLNKERKNGDIELLGLAVTQTIKNGGLVFLPERNKMPNGKPAAAIFRY